MPLVTSQQFPGLTPDVLGAQQRGEGAIQQRQRGDILSQELINKQQLAEQQRKKAGLQAQQLGTRQRALGVSGTPEQDTQTQAQLRMIADNPQVAKQLLDSANIVSGFQRDDAARFATEALAAPDEVSQNAIISNRIRTIAARGGDPGNSVALLQMPMEQRLAALQGLKTAALTVDQQLAERKVAIEERKVPERKIIKDVSGRQRFIDTGQAVFPTIKETDSPETIAKKEKVVFDNSQKLRKEFIAQSKDFRLVNSANSRIKASLTDPSAAGDLALIFNYMKILDPGSVVRESEFATAESAGSVPQRIWGQYNKVLRGERLSAPQRKDFENRADKLFNAQVRDQNRLRSQYTKLAETFELDPATVLIDIADREALGEQTKRFTVEVVQ